MKRLQLNEAFRHCVTQELYVERCLELKHQGWQLSDDYTHFYQYEAGDVPPAGHVFGSVVIPLKVGVP